MASKSTFWEPSLPSSSGNWHFVTSCLVASVTCTLARDFEQDMLNWDNWYCGVHWKCSEPSQFLHIIACCYFWMKFMCFLILLLCQPYIAFVFVLSISICFCLYLSHNICSSTCQSNEDLQENLLPPQLTESQRSNQTILGITFVLTVFISISVCAWCLS